ncbi:TPA: bacteriocin immunity protein, partial [Escherichia coli]
MFAGKKSAQIREILISESAWEEMTCLFAPSLVDHFIKITEHPKKGDLIFYPNSQEDGEPENILKIVKEWRRSQGLP